MIKIIIFFKDDAPIKRIAGYIGELPRKADWEDVIDHLEKADEELS